MSIYLFTELVQVALGNKEKLSHTPTYTEWMDIYSLVQKQAIVGIVFCALDNLCKCGQNPPKDLFLEWLGQTELIKQCNLLFNKRCAEISTIFKDAGYESCILKGQGNARMYPNPDVRQPGDIDIWINASKKDIISLVKKLYPDVVVAPHHVNFPIFSDVEVEVHFSPDYSIKSRCQKKFKKYVEIEKLRQFSNFVEMGNTGGTVSVPTDDFNIIHQLMHLQRHFFYEGVGLRQIIDFYYLVIHAHNRIDNDRMVKTLQSLGLLKFANGLMWILMEVLGLDRQYLITYPDNNRGKLLLEEIIQTGNFGHYESRYFKKVAAISKTLSVLLRNLRLIWYFPKEAFSSPITEVNNEIYKWSSRKKRKFSVS